MPQTSRPEFLHLVLFATAYLAGSWLGQWLALMPQSFGTFWPPSGLYLAVLLLSEPRRWPWWVMAGLAAEVAADLWLFRFPLPISLAVYLGNTLEALIGARLILRWCGTPFRFPGLREVLALILVGAALSPAIGATVGAAAMALAGRSGFDTVWPIWWAGDATGILIAAPVVLTVLRDRVVWRGLTRARWAEALAIFVVFAAAAHLVFSGRFPFTYLIMPPLLWAALRFGMSGAAITMALLAAMALSYTAAGQGVFANLDVSPERRVWLVLMFLSITAVSALVVAALTGQHRRALRILQRARDELDVRVGERTAELRESEERLRLFVEYAPAAVAMFDREMRYLAASRRWLNDYRLEGSVLGRSHYEVFPDLPERWKEAHRRALGGEVMGAEEDRFEWADGLVQWVRWEVRPWHGADGTIGGIVIFTEDITERKSAEERLRESEEEFRTMFEISSVGKSETDPATGRFQRVNAALCRLTGYSEAELLQRTFMEITHPEDRALDRERYNRFVRGEASHYVAEKRCVRRDGDIIWVHVTANIIHHPAGRRMRTTAVIQDITARKQAEAALRASEEFVRGVLDSLPQEVAVLDKSGVVRTVNEPWQRFARENGGRVPAVSVGANYLDVCRRAAAEAEPYARETLEALEALLAGRSEECVMEYPCHAPDRERWFLMNARPLSCDSSGLLISHMDITQLKCAEEALREADRRKDEFLATLAHELRNPLAPIRNALHVLQRSGGEGPGAERLRMMMERQVNHLVRLVDDLLEVSRITRGKIDLRRERIDLAAVIGHALETSQPLIKAGGHELNVSLPPEPLLIDADPVRLAQVFANLLNNAAKYTEAGGKIELTARREGNAAIVSVRDSGVGIPPSMLPRVFDLFTQVDRTLGRAQGGLGIGLALVRSLVELHGGRVEAHSEGGGRGSEFVVRLPLSSAHPADAAAPGALPFARRAPRRILVVDDNRDAADSLGLLLESLDAEVRVAYDGPAALAALGEFKPAVVLLDLGMPGMDGFEAARRMRQHPDGREVTLIALTGWGQEEDRRRTRRAGFDHHLTKPADFDTLQTLLASLDESEHESPVLNARHPAP